MKRRSYLMVIGWILAYCALSTPAYTQTLAGGKWHALAICNDATAMAWGFNGWYELGNSSMYRSNIPVAVNGISGIKAVEGGSLHSMALRNDGTVWAWGGNEYGQLGTGSLDLLEDVPTQVPGLAGIIAISADDYHSLALKNDGTVWTWGWNEYGTLGNDTTINSNIPVQVHGLANVIAISGGGIFSVALKSDGTVWTWGSNDYGVLGDSTYIDRDIPVQVPNFNGITAISAGDKHTLALKNDGTVWAWGHNVGGALGYSALNGSNVPGQVDSISGATVIEAGCYSSYALTGDGSLWVWGDNQEGQLGIGTTGSYVPPHATTITGITGISAGCWYAHALKSDGTVWGWGWNDEGQLGIGNYTDTLVPVQLTGICLPLGVESPAVGGRGSVSAFPNPFHSETTIHFEPPVSRADIMLYNANGQIVRILHNITGKSVTLEREGLPSGIYFIRIIQKEKLIGSGKVVVVD